MQIAARIDLGKPFESFTRKQHERAKLPKVIGFR